MIFKKSEYRCSCGGTRHKCDLARIAELEAENKTTNGIISGLANVVKGAGEDLQRAEAALAKRDRMLGEAELKIARHWHFPDTASAKDMPGDARYVLKLLADLRARAEEGSE